MKTTVRVPVIVRREHRPEWGKHCCIYLIHYLNGFLYAGRLLETKYQKLGYPYVGSGLVLEVSGLKLQRICTFHDLSYHASQIAFIEQWYCDPRFHSRLESWFIRKCASHYGISPRVLGYFEVNPFTEQFVHPEGLLLNVTDNGWQHCKTASAIEAHREVSRKNGCKAASNFTSEQLSKAASILNLKFTSDQLHQKARKSADTKKVKNLHRVHQSIVVEFPTVGSWTIKPGLEQICHYLESVIGNHFSSTSLGKSLKRNNGDTIYKGIHFKYASLLTEEELKNAVTL